MAKDSKNSKALFRRAKCYKALNDVDKAVADFTLAYSLDPSEASIPKELEQLKVLEKQQQKKQQKFYANMFEKLNKSEDDVSTNSDSTKNSDNTQKSASQ